MICWYSIIKYSDSVPHALTLEVSILWTQCINALHKVHNTRHETVVVMKGDCVFSEVGTDFLFVI